MKDEMTEVSLNDISDTAVESHSSDNKEHNHSHGHHHHHHHHHSSHKHRHYKHSKHKRSNSKSKDKWKAFYKKNKKKLMIIGIAVLVIIILIVLGCIIDAVNSGGTVKDDNKSDNKVASAVDSSVEIKAPFFTESVSLVHDAVLQYISPDNTLPITEIYLNNHSKGRLDVGLPVTLNYDITDIPDGISVKSVEIKVDDNPYFYNPRVFSLSSTAKSVDVYYLMTNTLYHYKITVLFSNDTETTVTGTFTTADTPRFLYLEGAVNVRDIGGLKTTDGSSVLQGMIYRGSEIDGAVEPTFKITDDAVTDMLTILGVKSDFDLRGNSVSDPANALGQNVRHNYYNILSYKDIFTDEGKAAVKDLFSDLANADNYPMYMHCTYGSDRTGTVCFILEALLGVSEKELIKDYELSAMYYSDISGTAFDDFFLRFKSLDGDTLKSKAENFLLSSGVTADEITLIRDILLS